MGGIKVLTSRAPCKIPGSSLGSFCVSLVKFSATVLILGCTRSYVIAQDLVPSMMSGSNISFFKIKAYSS
jgi:hypothetical protein